MVPMLLALIDYLHANPRSDIDFHSIRHLFAEYDQEQIDLFVDELTILGVVSKDFTDNYGLTEISGQVYAKLRLQN
jgi:hypothetical protein